MNQIQFTELSLIYNKHNDYFWLLKETQERFKRGGCKVLDTHINRDGSWEDLEKNHPNVFRTEDYILLYRYEDSYEYKKSSSTIHNKSPIYFTGIKEQTNTFCSNPWVFRDDGRLEITRVSGYTMYREDLKELKEHKTFIVWANSVGKPQQTITLFTVEEFFNIDFDLLARKIQETENDVQKTIKEKMFFEMLEEGAFDVIDDDSEEDEGYDSEE